MASISPSITTAETVRYVDKPGWMKNPFVRFFLWASKTDTRLMQLCSGSTRRTHVARGFFVMGTGIAAGAACFYFLYTTIGDVRVAAAIAPLCGSIIFMFDRELVGGATVRSALIRILLSLMLGIAISIPFEMRLLQGRIDNEIQRRQLAENTSGIQALKARNAEIDAHQAQLRAQIANLRSQQQEAIRNKEAEVVGSKIEGQTTGIRGEGPAFRAADQRLRELQGQITDVQGELAGLQQDRDRAQADFNAQKINAIYDFPARYEALKKFVPRYSPLWQLGWAITAIIVLFDMFPVLSKFLGSATDYDVLQRTEVAENIHRAQKISEHTRESIEQNYLEWHPTTIEVLESYSRPAGQ